MWLVRIGFGTKRVKLQSIYWRKMKLTEPVRIHIYSNCKWELFILSLFSCMKVDIHTDALWQHTLTSNEVTYEEQISNKKLRGNFNMEFQQLFSTYIGNKDCFNYDIYLFCISSAYTLIFYCLPLSSVWMGSVVAAFRQHVKAAF